ncbi:hypothetical protein CAEBREN_10602 [Caenorhabditis brenneri]|uniref:Uncharacterized protein n=1 Tax=Caenorhabditis brenneri TaxID=135651 RepID=G0N7S9_CAEBE|nr:hypothetical protein CAEBREN_10602 [Caenorhabditis brenneri]
MIQRRKIKKIEATCSDQT